MRVDDKGNALSWTNSLSAGYVKIKRLADDVELPKKAHIDDAGFDLRAHLPNDEFHEWGGGKVNGIKIRPGETVMIGTGIAMSIPVGYFGGVFARSGLSTKEGLRPANCVGVVDCSYTGEVMVPLYNDSNETRIITNGQRIAQLVILPCPDVELVEVDNLDKTTRNDGGFGSSGV